MDSELQKGVMSGDSTPEYPKTPAATSSIGRLRRTDSQETLLTSITEVESVQSTPSLNYPAPPLNSPMTMSEVGDRETPDPDSLASKLQSMPSNLADVTPPKSQRDDDEGKQPRHPGNMAKDSAQIHGPPLATQYRVQTLIRRPVERTDHLSRAPERDATPTPAKTRGPMTPHGALSRGLFPEHTTWAQVAEEDVVLGLKRLAMAARDEELIDPSKPAEQIYNERLIRLLRAAEFKVDLSALR
ncbi:hypothetical protein LTR53_015942 [Teratosphaeriaceae sp. CCFEE 6253]|nr:hypothetical protein LTR53_015942 [Teratosphaeriaceae sp. CCFEE 6253]